jgi:hypothetical protein
MDPFEEIISYELCFPGAVTGSAEVECPHCETLLTASVDDPMGQEAYECSACSGSFVVDWECGRVIPN